MEGLHPHSSSVTNTQNQGNPVSSSSLSGGIEKVDAQTVVIRASHSPEAGCGLSLSSLSNPGFLRSTEAGESSIDAMSANLQILNGLVDQRYRKNFNSQRIQSAFQYLPDVKTYEKSMCDRFLELMSDMSRLEAFNTPEGKKQFASEMLSLIAFLVEDPTGEAIFFIQLIHQNLELRDCNHLKLFNRLCNLVKTVNTGIYYPNEDLESRPRKGFLFMCQGNDRNQIDTINQNIRILKGFVSDEDKKRFDAINLERVFQDGWSGAELVDMMGSLSLHEEFRSPESKNELACKLLAVLEAMQKDMHEYEAVKAFVVSPEYEDDIACLDAITGYLNSQNPEVTFPTTIRTVSEVPSVGGEDLGGASSSSSSSSRPQVSSAYSSSSARQRRLKKEESDDARIQRILSSAFEQQNMFESQFNQTKSTYTRYS